MLSYIKNYNAFNEFYSKHRRHNHSRHTLQSYFNIYEVDPSDKVLFQYLAGFTCHYCNEDFIFLYDETKRNEIIPILHKYGIKSWEVATSA